MTARSLGAALTIGGASGLAQVGAAIPHIIASANAGGTDLGALVTGGGALSLTGVLGYIALKLSRGELVVRDVKAVEVALLKVAEDRRAEGEEHRQIITSTQALTREVIEELAASRADRRRGDP